MFDFIMLRSVELVQCEAARLQSTRLKSDSDPDSSQRGFDSKKSLTDPIQVVDIRRESHFHNSETLPLTVSHMYDIFKSNHI